MILLEVYTLFAVLYSTHASTYQIKCERQDLTLVNNEFTSECGSRIRLPCERTVKFPSPTSCDEYLQCKGNKIELCRCGIYGKYFVTSAGECLVGDENKNKCGCPPTISPPPTPPTPPTTMVPTTPTANATIKATDESREETAAHARTLAIVWGVIGGIVIIAISILLGVIYYMRRRSRETASKSRSIENPEYNRTNSVILSEMPTNESTNGHVATRTSSGLAPVPAGRPLPEIPTADDSGQKNGGSHEYMNEYHHLIRPHSGPTDSRASQNSGVDNNENQAECIPLSPIKTSSNPKDDDSDDQTYRSS